MTLTPEQQRTEALETKFRLAFEQRDAARMDAHDAKAALAASHERERGLREALELIAWSKPPIRETEGEWRLKAQVVAREALAAQSKESEDSRA